jgi:hypothetical protein
VTRRKGELTGSRIDREWPHQVAIRADQVAGKNYSVPHDFCRDLSLCPRGHSVLRENVTYIVFCFADAKHADLFREQFNGGRSSTAGHSDALRNRRALGAPLQFTVR